ncbi:MAG: sodium:proton antiporter [Oscillospiraceae bacterium]|nr:sodium:proton antiporter [Oscillospiraceae bacterium]
MTALAFIVAVFFPFLAAILLYILGVKHEKARDGFILFVCVVELASVFLLFLSPGAKTELPSFCWLGLHFRAEGFSALMAVLAAFLWLCTALVSPEYFAHAKDRNRYYLFYLLTLGALEGVFLSADLGTTFVFFEVMSFTSYVWVAQNETAEALEAARVYLAVAVLGGLVLLMGLYLLYDLVAPRAYGFSFDAVRAAAAALPKESRGRLFAAGCCLLFGFGAKAGMFPLHIWLPMAHPVAPAPASALLSGILTKSGVFGVLVVTTNLFVGNERWGALVLVLGTITMVGGAVLAVLSRDLKRTLACSSMSQIGFILVGVGMRTLLGHEGILSVWGTVLHMLNHSLIKLVLFVAAGVVYLNTHSLDLQKVRGFGRGKIWLLVTFLIAAASIGGIPLWSGYVSKTLLHEGIVEYIHAGGAYAALCRVVEVLFLASGGLTVAYMTNLFVTLFIDKPEKETRGRYMGAPTKAVLAVGAALLLVGGVIPHFTMERLAQAAESFLGADSSAMHSVHYFSPENLKGAAISIAVGALVYFLIMRRPVLPKLASFVNAFRLGFAKAFFAAVRGLVFVLAMLTRFAAAVGDWTAAFLIKIIFFRAPRIVVPRQHETYGRDKREHIIEKTFSLDLLLSGLGLLAIIAYLLFQSREAIF